MLSLELATDYIRISKLKIVSLLDFVAIAALLVAAGSNISIETLAMPLVALFVAGTLSSAGAGAFNAYLDRDIDAMMARTMNRPIPLGRINPPIRALQFGVLMIGIAAAVSLSLLNFLSTIMILLGAFTYIVIYTIFLKRRTTWNIVLGGFAGSFAALAGWTAVRDSIGGEAILMALLIFLWTPSHFWSLAILTNRDYQNAGIPMLPAIVGERKASRYIVFNTLLLIPFSLLFYFLGYNGQLYLAITSIVGALLLVTNLRMLKEPSKENSWTAFKFSSPYLALVFTAMVLDTIFRF
ncbi:MAG: protoheme IX farnesyltransferase [Thaumarchaeota archaeon]|nr:protoheme IX farnesyltransferase [Nitrososphaerota archaeon]